MYDGITKAVGPGVKKTAFLKSLTGNILTDRNKQMEKWAEHYVELYSRETVVTDKTLDGVRGLPLMGELDGQPIVEELSGAIDSPGSDVIPPEVMKCGKPALTKHPYKLLCLCWGEGSVPEGMHDNIATIYKNKGDHTDCNNYKGISLLSIVGEIFAHVVLN